MGQDILSHLALICIERACVNRVDFQSILDQKTLMIHFGTCKKSELVLCLSKRILALATDKKTATLITLCSHDKPLSQFPPDDF